LFFFFYISTYAWVQVSLVKDTAFPPFPTSHSLAFSRNDPFASFLGELPNFISQKPAPYNSEFTVPVTFLLFSQNKERVLSRVGADVFRSPPLPLAVSDQCPFPNFSSLPYLSFLIPPYPTQELEWYGWSDDASRSAIFWTPLILIPFEKVYCPLSH